MVRPKHETQMVFEPLPLPEGREDMINTPSEMKLPSKANKNIHLECITNPVLRGPRKMAEEKNKTVSETLHTQAKNLNSEDQQRIHKEEKHYHNLTMVGEEKQFKYLIENFTRVMEIIHG